MPNPTNEPLRAQTSTAVALQGATGRNQTYGVCCAFAAVVLLSPVPLAVDRKGQVVAAYPLFWVSPYEAFNNLCSCCCLPRRAKGGLHNINSLLCTKIMMITMIYDEDNDNKIGTITTYLPLLLSMLFAWVELRDGHKVDGIMHKTKIRNA